MHHLQHEPPSVAEARDQARSHAPHGSLCKPHSCTCNGCTTTRSARLRRARALRWGAARPRGACRDPQGSEALIRKEHDRLRALRGGEVARARRTGDRMGARAARPQTFSSRVGSLIACRYQYGAAMPGGGLVLWCLTLVLVEAKGLEVPWSLVSACQYCDASCLWPGCVLVARRASQLWNLSSSFF